MHIKQTLARAGALATATAFISVVAVAPGHATLVRSDSAASTQAQQSQANQAERAESRGNGPRESRSTADKPAAPARSTSSVPAPARTARISANSGASARKKTAVLDSQVTLTNGRQGYIRGLAADGAVIGRERHLLFAGDALDLVRVGDRGQRELDELGCA